MANIQQYDFFNAYYYADGIVLNIYLSSIKDWLREQRQYSNCLGNFYRQVVSRFNSFYKEIISTGDRDQCILICFSGTAKKNRKRCIFDFYTEAVLNVDSEIIDNDDVLMEIKSSN